MNLFKIILIYLFLENTLCDYENIKEALSQNYRRLMRGQDASHVSRFKYEVKMPNGTLYVKFKFIPSKQDFNLDDVFHEDLDKKLSEETEQFGVPRDLFDFIFNYGNIQREKVSTTTTSTSTIETETSSSSPQPSKLKPVKNPKAHKIAFKKAMKLLNTKEELEQPLEEDYLWSDLELK